MRWRLKVELANVLLSLSRINMVPGAKKLTELLLNYFYSAVNLAWRIQEGIL